MRKALCVALLGFVALSFGCDRGPKYKTENLRDARTKTEVYKKWGLPDDVDLHKDQGYFTAVWREQVGDVMFKTTVWFSCEEPYKLYKYKREPDLLTTTIMNQGK